MALVSSPDFPWVASTVRQGSQELTAISYVEDYQPPSLPTQPFELPDPDMQDFDASITVVGTGGFTSEAPAQQMPSEEAGPSAIEFQEPPLGSDLSVDIETYNRVQNFLSPPESRTDTQLREDKGLYGLQTSMADEELGQHQPKHSPTGISGTAKTFPSLPWDFVFTPTPNRPSHRESAGGPAEALSRVQGYPSSYGMSGLTPSDNGFVKPTTRKIVPCAWLTLSLQILPAEPECPLGVWEAGSRSCSSTVADGRATAPSAGCRGARSGSWHSSHVPQQPGQPARGQFPAAPQMGVLDTSLQPGSPWGRFPSEASGLAFGGGGSAFHQNPPPQHSSVSSLAGLQSPRGRHNHDGGIAGAGHEGGGSKWQNTTTTWGRGRDSPNAEPAAFRKSAKPASLSGDDSADYDRNALLNALKDHKPRH